jgi:hypothetical protein
MPFAVVTIEAKRGRVYAFGHGRAHDVEEVCCPAAVWNQIGAAHVTRLGPEDPDTLTVRAEIAESTGLAGDPAQARDLFAELLPIYQRVEGPEDLETLGSARASSSGPLRLASLARHATCASSCCPSRNGFWVLRTPTR